VHTTSGSDTVTARLRAALTGSADTPQVLLGNFEVEDRWTAGEPGLPTVAFRPSRAIVNHMDEFGLLLGAPDDHVVVKSAPDPDYLGYLSGLGIELPRVVPITAPRPDRTVTEDALADERVLAVLRRLGADGAWLWPHGVSDHEEELARRCGLALAAPPAAACKAVNSKIYSRLAADRSGVRQPPGMVCRDLDELAEAVRWAGTRLAAGRQVVLKDAYGVSGKGLLVVADPARLERIQQMMTRRAVKRGDRRVALVMEEWLPKRTDLNYQFTVDREGRVHFDVVKELVTEGGVHQGHRMPARLSPEHDALVRETAATLGAHLARDGHFGVVGIDALITAGGTLYPVIEINARNNMSTYQERLRPAFFGGDEIVLANQYSLSLRRPVPFAELRKHLGDVLLRPGAGSGVLVNNFATVNAAASEATGRSFDGRLYAIVIGSSPEQAQALHQATTERLRNLAAAASTP
jgi:hypothetical protein